MTSAVLNATTVKPVRHQNIANRATVTTGSAANRGDAVMVRRRAHQFLTGQRSVNLLRNVEAITPVRSARILSASRAKSPMTVPAFLPLSLMIVAPIRI